MSGTTLSDGEVERLAIKELKKFANYEEWPPIQHSMMLSIMRRLIMERQVELDE